MKFLIALFTMMLVAAFALPSTTNIETQTKTHFVDGAVQVQLISVDNINLLYTETAGEIPITEPSIVYEQIENKLLISEPGKLQNLSLYSSNSIHNALYTCKITPDKADIGNTEFIHRKRLCLVNKWKFLEKQWNLYGGKNLTTKI